MNDRSWCRSGNIFRAFHSGTYLTNHVRFNSAASMIFEVAINYYNDKTAYAQLSVSPFHCTAVRSYFNKHFNNNEIKFSIDGLTIRFTFNANSAEKLIQVFLDINNKYKQDEFPQELISEIKHISEKLQKTHGLLNDSHEEHILSDKIATHFNPKRSGSTKLVRLFDKNITTLANDNSKLGIFMDAVNECLTQGEDPSQIDAGGNSAFYYVLIRKLHKKLFKELTRLLFIYAHVNPYNRGFNAAYGSFLSPIEKVIGFQSCFKKIKYIELLCSQLKRPLPMSGTIETRVISTSKMVITSILGKNQLLHTIIKNTANLTHIEHKSLFALFSEIYEVDHSSKHKYSLEDTYNKDFSGENKHIEIIYADENIVGFNLYEMITLKQHPDHVILNCVHSMIKPEYRGGGMMSMLNFRLAFVLQILFPDSVIGIFFIAIHANIGMLPENLNWLYHPKYGEQDEIVREIITEIGECEDYYRNNMKCYISQFIKVREPIKPAHSPSHDHVIKRFYEENIRGASEGYACKGVPMLTYVGEETYKELCKSLFPQINFDNEVGRLANTILESGYKLCPMDNQAEYNKPVRSSEVRLLNNTLLFWCGEKKRTMSTLNPSIDTRLKCGL